MSVATTTAPPPVQSSTPESSPEQPTTQPAGHATDGVYTPRNILVTGGAGFIGSHFIRTALTRRPDITVVNYDALTYAGNLENLTDIEGNPRYKFVKGDICQKDAVERALAEFKIDTLINFAAESHVDRSILSSAEFVRTNIGGTQTLLDAAVRGGVKRFVQVSTDEVYGSLGATGHFTETTPLAPNNPYSATKAGADVLCRSYHRTHGYDVVVTRCSNNYGPFQFPEKLIPLMTIKAMKGEKLPVYGDGMQVRDWIHAVDHGMGVLLACERGRAGEVYNFGSVNEWANIEIVRMLLKILGRGEELIEYVKDRPGHDRRYAIDSTKARTELGWAPQMEFDEGLAATVQWYRDNPQWWQRVMSGAYLQYYEENYAGKMGG